VTFRRAAPTVSTVVLFVSSVQGAGVLSLDGSRTGNEGRPGDDRYLTSDSMVDATNILLDAGFAISTTSLFTADQIAGFDVLYTGAVDVDFTAQELDDIEAFVLAGGGLVMQRDWGDFFPAADPLAAVFGVTYGTAPEGPPSPWPVNKTVDHPIWDGPAGAATSYLQQFSASIASGADIIGAHEGSGNGALGVVDYGLGRVVFLSDMDAWDSLGDDITPMPGNDNGIVWENIFHYASPAPGALPVLAVGLLWGRRRREG
jgi:MYXO-CTERM domain-containing protein